MMSSGRVVLSSIGRQELVREPLAARGYVFVDRAVMRGLLEASGPLSDWPAFAASWDQLEPDTYLADRGRYRRRRHAVFSAKADGTLVREPDQPHIQSAEYNLLFGGIARWFAPVLPAIAAGPSLSTILRFCRTLFDSLAS